MHGQHKLDLITYCSKIYGGMDLTAPRIAREYNEISCRNGFIEQVSYRARILGTDFYSAIGLVEILQEWVNTGQASINIGFSQLEIDPNCPVSRESLSALDCPTSSPTPSTQSTPSTSKSGP